MSVESRVARFIASALLAGTVAAAVIAAAPAPPPPAAQLEELDTVLVTGKNLVPLPDFVKFPKYESVAVSPGGTRLLVAWIDDNNGYRLQIGINEFPSMKALHNHSVGAEYSASEVGWASETRLLYQTRWPLSGLKRVQEPIGMIMTTNLDGGSPYTINREAISTMYPLDMQRRDEEAVAAVARPYDAGQAGISNRDSIGPVRVVATRTGTADQLLFQTTRANQRSGSAAGTGAFLLNLKDNKQSQVATLPLPGGRFVLGPDSRVAIATGVNADNETVVYYLPEKARAAGKDWQLVERSAAGARGLQPVAWSGSGEEYYALDGRDTPTRAVVIWNAVTNTRRELYRHASADMDHFSLDPSGKPWMFHGRELFPVYWYPDPEHPLARLHRAVVRKLPGEQVEITSASDDLKSAVVRVSSGRRPPVHLVVNVDSASSMAAMFSYPTLRGRRLAQVDPFEVRARDGMVLHGYVTTPEDGAGRILTRLPMVVIAHDGPQDEPSSHEYEFERQLFASRGYAVLQVNHRGTRGRGTAYERAGDGKWGSTVQEDYVDAIRWAIRDGTADPSRICFYGTGYGAFSAMTAAAREPGLFSCVIGVGGVYDLSAMLGGGKKAIPAALRQVFGDNLHELKASSPVSKAASIKARVLLMPEDREELVPNEQSTLMRNALKEAGNAARWEMLSPQYTPETRSGGYTRILKFLEDRIGK